MFLQPLKPDTLFNKLQFTPLFRFILYGLCLVHDGGGVPTYGGNWIGDSGVPLDVRYPGEYVAAVKQNSNGTRADATFPLEIGSTAGKWQKIEVSARIHRRVFSVTCRQTAR